MRKILAVAVALLGVMTVFANDSTAVSHRLEFSLRGAYVLPSNHHNFSRLK